MCFWCCNLTVYAYGYEEVPGDFDYDTLKFTSERQNLPAVTPWLFTRHSNLHPRVLKNTPEGRRILPYERRV